MSDRRLVKVWYDVVNKVHRDESGDQLNTAQHPYLYFMENPLVNVQLVKDGDLTPVDDLSELPAGCTFSVSVDDDFDHGSSVLMAAVNAAINQPGEWLLTGDSSSVGNTANVAAGEFSFKLNGNTAELETALGTNKTLQATLEILVFASGGEVLCVFQLPMTALNIVDDQGASPPTVLSTLVASGATAIANGASTVTVTGMGLSAAPTTVIVSIMNSSNDSSGGGEFNIFATVDGDTITADGFIASLSAATDSGTYELHWIAL